TFRARSRRPTFSMLSVSSESAMVQSGILSTPYGILAFLRPGESSVTYEAYRKTALEMIMAGVKAADPTEVIKRNVKVAGDTITICDRTFSRPALDRIL